MAHTELHSFISYLRRLGQPSDDGGSSDSDLLDRFVQSREDAAWRESVSDWSDNSEHMIAPRIDDRQF